MSSTSSQSQFRYTQLPSKVLHLRNLPWECTEEELIKLGNPLGRFVNTKCSVGAYRNQAFIEFAELNQAIPMISYYASSSELAQVFSAFGFVHKITTFDKTAGFQALVQFSDAETAISAKDVLDGRSIPRDYTNSLLPVATSAIDASGQFSLGLDGKKLEPESNVLLASVENMQYAVTLDGHTRSVWVWTGRNWNLE